MWLLVAVPLLAAVLAGAIAVRPARFWPVLTLVVIAASGVMIQGNALVDEVLIGALLVGCLLPIAVRGVPRRQAMWTHPARLLFLLFVGYMIGQSLRALLVFGDWRVIRWGVYYLMLGLILHVTSRWAFPLPDGRQASRNVALSGILYLSLYLGHGAASEMLRGLSRWQLQGVEWSGSAYALFPLVVVVPAAIFLLREHRRGDRWIGATAILLAMAAAVYYESRISWLVILALFMLSPTAFGLRKRIVLYGLLLVMLAAVVRVQWDVDFGAYLSSFWESARGIYAPRESDLDRRLHLVAALQVVGRDWPTLLFGAGVQAHRHIMAPYLKELSARDLPGVAIGDTVRTTGFSALLVDGGLVAVLLLGGIFLLAAREMLMHSRAQRRNRPITLVSLTFIFLWPLVSNIQDMVLFYAAVMPSGLLGQLSRHAPATRPVREDARPGASPA